MNSKYYEFVNKKRREKQIEKQIKDKKQKRRGQRKRKEMEEEEEGDVRPKRTEISLEEVVRTSRKITKNKRNTKTRAYSLSDSNSSESDNSSSSSNLAGMETENIGKPQEGHAGTMESEASKTDNVPATILMSQHLGETTS